VKGDGLRSVLKERCKRGDYQFEHKDVVRMGSAQGEPAGVNWEAVVVIRTPGSQIQLRGAMQERMVRVTNDCPTGYSGISRANRRSS